MEQQEYNRPLPTIISKSKAVTVPTVRVADVDSGHEFRINRADWVEGRYEVLDGTDVKLLGTKKAMDADEKLLATLAQLAGAISGNGGSDSGELDAARAEVAELKALVLAAHEEADQAKNGDGKAEPARFVVDSDGQTTDRQAPPPVKKKTKKKAAKRKPRKVEAKK